MGSIDTIRRINIFKIRRKLHCCFISAMVGLWLGACSFKEPLPVYQYEQNCYAVDLAVGPEDFVLDQWNHPPRLLVSSYNRRTNPITGEIYSFDIKSGYAQQMHRVGEPSRLTGFKPHGMDIRRAGKETFLYVIIHDPFQLEEREENAIGVYRVIDQQLEFIELLEAPVHLWSPNDLSVLENGDIYVTNDYRYNLEMFLGLRTSEIAFFSVAEQKWKVVATDIAFANGILAKPDQVFVSATRGDCIQAFPRFSDGRLGNSRIIAKIKGPDNIMPYGDRLIVTAHYNDYAFLAHGRDTKAVAPSVVFLIDPNEKDSEKMLTAIYVDNGTQISAASTAFIHNQKLYISQVFDAHMVICETGDLPLIQQMTVGHK